MISTKALAAIAALALLAGCAQAPKKQAFNRDAATHIKSIVLTQAPNQDSYEAAVLGHPGMSFGLIGGLIAAADMQAKSSKLSAAIDPTLTRLQDRFSERLSENLARAGYQTQVVVLPKDTKEEQIVTVARQKASGDAVLAVGLIGAYWAAGPSSDYFPRLLVRVRQIEAASGNTLYEDTFTYGYANPQAQTIHLASDAQYRFADIDALVADPDKTRQGWYAGLDAIAAQIAADLKKN